MALAGEGVREKSPTQPPALRCVGDVGDSEVERAGVKGGRSVSSRAGPARHRSARDPRLDGGWHARSPKEKTASESL